MTKQELISLCEKTYNIPSGKLGNGKWHRLLENLPPEIKKEYNFKTDESIRWWFKRNRIKEEVYSSSVITREVLGKDGTVKTLKTERVSYKPQKDNVDYKKLWKEIYSEFSPSIKKTVIKENNKPVLLITIADWHYGLLAKDYNAKIAEKVLKNAVYQIIEKTKHKKFAKIILNLNGDLYHYDTMGKTTTKGTPQDTCLLPEEMIKGVNRVIAELIQYLSTVNYVEVFVQGGNHDEILSIQLNEFLVAFFSQNKKIVVYNNSTLRNYVFVNGVLFGLTHTIDPLKAKDVVITEARKFISNSKRIIWIASHLHSKSTTGDFGMIEFWRTTTLCGSSSWEEKSGYKSQSLMEAHIINEDSTVDTVSVKGE